MAVLLFAFDRLVRGEGDGARLSLGKLEFGNDMDFETQISNKIIRPLGDPQRLAIVMPTWVGDACMATPTLRAVRRRYPNAKITMISRPVIRDVIANAWGSDIPWIDDYLLVSKKVSAGAHTRLSLTKAVRSAGITSALLLTNSFWSAAAMRLAGVRRVIGYQRDARGWLLSDRVPVVRAAGKPKPISAIDYYLELARWMGCDTSNRSMQLYITAEQQQMVEKLYCDVGLNPHGRTLVVNSNAATEVGRLWPEDRVSELCRRVAVELGMQVLLHCGPQEREQANRIAMQLNHRNVASMGVWDELPISLSCGVLGSAAAVVSTDSGPRHIAVALNRRVVTLYGPTSPAWTTTYNRPEISVQHFENGQAAMEHISVDEVMAAVRLATEEGISEVTQAA